MSGIEQRPTTPTGEAFFRELLFIHALIRRDLTTVRDLAGRVTNGLPARKVKAELESLEADGLLWQLRLNCLDYCRFVHHHHRLEDVALFPALRRTNPDLGPVVDRLEDDHRKVSDYLDEVEAAADDLQRDDTEQERRRVVGSLENLAEHLLAHLEFEEENAGPTMRRMTYDSLL